MYSSLGIKVNSQQTALLTRQTQVDKYKHSSRTSAEDNAAKNAHDDQDIVMM